MTELEKIELESLHQEKRDRMNSRLVIWSLLFGVVGAAGFASAQNSEVSYLLALYPLIAVSVARYAGHNESVIDQIKAYLLQVAENYNHQGYEQFNKGRERHRRTGSHAKAFRSILIVTEVIAASLVTYRLIQIAQVWAAVAVALVSLVCLVYTYIYLHERKPKERAAGKPAPESSVPAEVAQV